MQLTCLLGYAILSFKLFLQIQLVNFTVSSENFPSIGQPDKAEVIIGMNGDAFGVFVIYTFSPGTTDESRFLEVREEAMFEVPLVIERRGGNLGTVSVEWRIVGGTATPNEDFTGIGGTLVFDGKFIRIYHGYVTTCKSNIHF